VASPVRWEDTIKYLASTGVTTYIEIGPGTVLSGLVRKVHKDATVFNLQAPEDLGALPVPA
jgi:[acyl-carrier-protein] S-malonyltransferase